MKSRYQVAAIRFLPWIIAGIAVWLTLSAAWYIMDVQDQAGAQHEALAWKEFRSHGHLASLKVAAVRAVVLFGFATLVALAGAALLRRFTALSRGHVALVFAIILLAAMLAMAAMARIGFNLPNGHVGSFGHW